MRNRLLLGFLLLVFTIVGQAQNQTTLPGFLDFNGYYDTRGYSVMTLNVLANLENRFQYFSLTNYESKDHSPDLSTYYSEQNIRWKIAGQSPFDLTYQWVMRQGSQNDDFRLGVRWRVNNTPGLQTFFQKIKMTYSINPMVFQFRVGSPVDYMTMIEHVYNIKLYKDRVYLGGFADQNLLDNQGIFNFKWVTEHQIGLRLVGKLFAVAEYRINNYQIGNQTGWGFGLEYKMPFTLN